MANVESRRRFIKRSSVFALSIIALPSASACLRDRSLASSGDSEHASRIKIADSNEPGTRILIRGTIYGSSGKPEPNVKLFLYHTDAEGYYSRPVSNPRQARLHGTVWSDSLGQYAFETIKPAHYAGVSSPPPMHIHVHLAPSGLPEHWVDSYYFEGDPRLRPEDINRASELGRFSNVLHLARAESGVIEGLRDFRIDPSVAERNQLVEGWYRNP